MDFGPFCLVRPPIRATGLLHEDLIVFRSGCEILEYDESDEEEEDEEDLELSKPNEGEDGGNGPSQRRLAPIPACAHSFWHRLHH